MGLMTRLSREEPAPTWGLAAAVGYVIGAFAAVVVGTTLTSSIFGDQPTTFIIGWSVAMILVALVITVTRNRTPQDGEALRIGETRAPLPIVLLLSLGVAILFDLISLIVVDTPWPVPELLHYFNTNVSPMRVLDVGVMAWILAVLFMVVFQPIGEELVFRGVVFPSLRANLGVWSGFFITAVFHAVFHLVSYAPSGGGGNFALTWYSLILPFLNGLYITGVRAYTGSTRAAIAAHAGIGLFLVLRALFFAG